MLMNPRIRCDTFQFPRQGMRRRHTYIDSKPKTLICIPNVLFVLACALFIHA